ncbi:MAG: 7-cyano-7-deazaguanine synthase QueC [Deltaproteobacteria bacterium]|nr:MAG: 7-cyano-7-deazaguanine synthase QueC [Deltaproteobacteria bacterium]
MLFKPLPVAEEVRLSEQKTGPREAVVLLSGGMDSATCLAVACSEGLSCHALTIDYGQRHHRELQAAAGIAASLGASEHLVMRVELDRVGGSALTGDMPVPRRPAEGIPVTYVPARNLVFLSLAVAWAEVLGARAVYIGVNQVDYSGYPDCRGEFLEAFRQAARAGTRAGSEGRQIEIRAPLLDLDKPGIIRLGSRLGVDFALTHTCYDPDSAGRACGRCPACRLRLEGFRRAGLSDPAPYQPGGRE